MIDIDAIKKLDVSPPLIAFTSFLCQEKGVHSFPDYQKLDLMKIPRLVPCIWVIDFRKGIDGGLLFHFSGTAMDRQYGYNITGHTWEDCYAGDHREKVLDHCFRKVYLEKKIGFTRRKDRFISDNLNKYRKIEALLFPCSQDDDHINFGIGITHFSPADDEVDSVYTAI